MYIMVDHIVFNCQLNWNSVLENKPLLQSYINLCKNTHSHFMFLCLGNNMATTTIPTKVGFQPQE